MPWLKDGVGILGPEISPELEIDGPLILLMLTEGAEKVGPLIAGLLKPWELELEEGEDGLA